MSSRVAAVAGTDHTAGAGLEIRRARKVYPASGSASEVLAVDDVDLTIAANEFVSIVGPSGCGKTTLLMATAGLVPLTSGEVRVNGALADGPSLDRAVVFQDAGLLPWRTARANVELGLETLKMPPAQRRETAQRYLSLVGLGQFANAHPRNLSGGMRQRVGLARALAVDPTVLLMDEPFAALDAQTRERMGEELLRVWSQQRKTVLFITHSLDEAIYLSDRVVVMTFRPGRVRADIPIPLDRPRDARIRNGSEFAELRELIWAELSDEVLRAERAEFDEEVSA